MRKCHTKSDLLEVLNRLKTGEDIYAVARNTGMDVDDMWSCARHYGYFTSTGRFVQDVKTI